MTVFRLNALDQEIAKRVRIFLASNRNGLAALTVSCEEGTVRLSGTVASFYLRQLAVACAKRVADVRNVVDELRVEYADGSSRFVRSVGEREPLRSS